MDARGAIQHKVSCANLDANSLCNLEHRGLKTLNSKIFSIILILNSKSTSEWVEVWCSCVCFESKMRALAVWHWPGIPKNCLGGIGNDRRNFSPGKRSFREAAGQGCTSPATYLGKDLHLRETKTNLRLGSMSRLFQPGFIIGLSTNHRFCFHPFCLLLSLIKMDILVTITFILQLQELPLKVKPPSSSNPHKPPPQKRSLSPNSSAVNY